MVKQIYVHGCYVRLDGVLRESPQLCTHLISSVSNVYHALRGKYFPPLYFFAVGSREAYEIGMHYGFAE